MKLFLMKVKVIVVLCILVFFVANMVFSINAIEQENEWEVLNNEEEDEEEVGEQSIHMLEESNLVEIDDNAMNFPEESVDSKQIQNVIADTTFQRELNKAYFFRDEMYPISAEDMATLSNIQVNGEYYNYPDVDRVRSLDGIQYAINLESLEITYADFRDSNAIFALQYLPANNLKYLTINSSRLSDESLMYISHLTNLISLDLANNNLESISGLSPLFDSLSNRLEVINQFYFNVSNNYLTDYSEFFMYYQYLKSIHESYGAPEEEVAYGIIADIIYSSMHDTYRHKNNDYWDTIDIRLPQLKDIWVIRETDLTGNNTTVIPIYNGITSIYGEPSLLAVSGDWRVDDWIMESIVSDSFFEYLNILANGGEYDYNNYINSDEYFTLKTRESKDYSEAVEYYFEGDQFNIVFYNPYATSKDDFQDAVCYSSGWYDDCQSYYYIELKGFDNGELVAGGNTLSIYTNEENSTNVIYPFIRNLSGDRLVDTYDSMPYIYSQTIRWIDPLDPIFEGDQRIEVPIRGQIDLYQNIGAYDPTINQENFDTSIPADLTDSIRVIENTVDLETAGEYQVTYEVTSIYGLATTFIRDVVVIDQEEANVVNQTEKDKSDIVLTVDNLELVVYVFGIVTSLIGIVSIKKSNTDF